MRPAFDRVASALRFEGIGRDLINGFKFRREFFLRDDLVDFLEGTVRARFKMENIGLVTAMPSTWWHRLLRGYNQCDVIASDLAARLKIPYARSLVRRVGSPRRQGELKEEERWKNVIGTFAATSRAKRLLPSLKGSVFVVDDIMTTGATLSECARVLKSVGARQVYAATLARSVKV